MHFPLIKKFLALTVILTSIVAEGLGKSIQVEVSNPSRFERAAVPVVIDLSQYGIVLSAKVLCSSSSSGASMIQQAPLPYQLDDLNDDGYNDELCFMTSLQAKETRIFNIELCETESSSTSPPLVYVEMLLSNKKIKEENKQNTYISSLTVDRGVNPYNQLHHHGAAFENTLVAYRIYFDHRQTVDIYGKYHRGLELHDTQFYPDAMQKQSGYGDDILWVGNTFGLGTLRGFDGKKPTMINDVIRRSQRIVARGPLRTIVEMTDEGWLPNAEMPSAQTDELAKIYTDDRITMKTRYTLYAGRRDCQVDVSLSKQPSTRFSTGIINIKNSEEYSDHHGLRGCWGTDWPVSEKDSVGHKRETVGLGICLPQQNVVSEWPADQDNYGFELRIPDNRLTYYISFCSDNEDFGFHSSKEWFEYLRLWKRERAIPPVIKITN